MINNGHNMEKTNFDAFINAVGSEIQQAQVRLITAANAQMLFHYWKMGNDILSADIARNAHYIRSNTMGIFVAAQVGRSVGEVANPLFDSSFLRSHALLRRFLRPVAV